MVKHEAQSRTMFAKALAEFCLRRGLTKAQAAVALGTSTPTLFRWSNGETRPHPATAKRIADVLGIDPVKLWGLP
jgi:transcriptional regulator with XRE-family HTH domain